ncbi:MAG: flagellar hook-associated protein FlgL [Clostridia bacterium]|nr:flagellar hook-associated protein FlgL [Clostridia bacterium]
MRITNQMMINSSISNIQVNKNQLNTLSTELSTQKKISKPSDDPIIAIRALRLRSSLDEVTQYLGKNIPDASSWLSVTHDALDEGYNIVSDLYRYCVQGSTDSYSESERNTLAESLQKLVEAFYSEGNVDYAGRYVFTGHATDKPLTYQSDDTAKDVDYTITQNFTRDNLSNKTAYTNAYSNQDILNLNVKTDINGNTVMPNVADVHRIQLAYDEINGSTFSISMGENNTTDITVNADGTLTATGTLTADVTQANGTVVQNTVNIVTTTDNNYVPGENEIAINSVTGELLLGENVYKSVYDNNEMSVTYNKSNFIKGDIDPTMYFDCIDNVTGIEYNKKSEDIEYIVNFSQKLKVNTEADEAFIIYLGRNVDDLISAVQNVYDLNDQIAQVESMMKEAQYSDDVSQEKLATIKEGLTKQKDLAEDRMTKAFETGIGQMQSYQEQISNAKADVGNRQKRLELTKTRLTEQKTNFTDLKSQNEDIDLEEIVVTYSSAELVYQAALSAASKVVQQTLLDFLG